MKTIINVLLWAAMVMTITLWGCAKDNSNDGDDDDNDNYGNGGDYDDWDSPECENDHAPELLSVQAIVNGVAREWPVTIQEGDALEIAIEYADVDCNLEGGGWGIIAEGSQSIWSDGDWFFDEEIGCSSEEEGKPYNLPIGTGYFVYPEDGPFLLEIGDSCGETSNRLPLEITTEI